MYKHILLNWVIYESFLCMVPEIGYIILDYSLFSYSQEISTYYSYYMTKHYVKYRR